MSLLPFTKGYIVPGIVLFLVTKNFSLVLSIILIIPSPHCTLSVSVVSESSLFQRYVTAFPIPDNGEAAITRKFPFSPIEVMKRCDGIVIATSVHAPLLFLAILLS